MATALAAALKKGALCSPTLHALDGDKKATGKGTALRAKVIRAQSLSQQEKNLKCAHVAIKAIIGLKSKSKHHADGRPLNGTGGNLQPHPKKEQFPVSSGKSPGVQDLISWS
jgi:hypothetical protein